ncbi:MAG: zf-HC2 domain-containing protein [Actinomycetota bacterium]|nr:zf-HC2 domain-containing protein [Actinomycetota bacterium]MDA2971666.1 zf-HC2 domain-containing protein [Actinomycetota bacterium]MDA3000210.1 zf-HC2 domain-containing protein [Actinomycetota bacterium]
MADCRDTLRELYSYLDDVLEESLRVQITTHLDDCPDCQDRVQFEYTLKARIRARAAEEPLPESLRQRLLDCLDLNPDDMDIDG